MTSYTAALSAGMPISVYAPESGVASDYATALATNIEAGAA